MGPYLGHKTFSIISLMSTVGGQAVLAGLLGSVGSICWFCWVHPVPSATSSLSTYHVEITVKTWAYQSSHDPDLYEAHQWHDLCSESRGHTNAKPPRGAPDQPAVSIPYTGLPAPVKTCSWWYVRYSLRIPVCPYLLS